MDNKRFDDYQEVKEVVKCNNCTQYWNDLCNGVSEGQEITCRSYIATRKVHIPRKLESLEKNINSVRISISITALALIIHLIVHLLGGY